MPFTATRNDTISTNRADILLGATATGAGPGVTNMAGYKTYQAWGTTSTSTGAAAIAVRGSNNGGVTWDTIGTISLTLGTTATSDGFTSTDRYALVSGNVVSISGTGAQVNLAVGW